MNKHLFLSVALTSISGNMAQSYAQDKYVSDRSDKRPNIILFMVDDMGWQDTSLPFWSERTKYNEVYETPNMESLAQRGMMFTQA